ncbi:unnamed protein product [Ambrosiozyma monospora]|uniref:Unnamed protein product n=1 Tax=Ambrosiozyma monospora TaxID=43982 RepID=A0ACB5T9A7_AMBMO|nr:unnamed protein product [Ambrosiozyma monospora]
MRDQYRNNPKKFVHFKKEKSEDPVSSSEGNGGSTNGRKRSSSSDSPGPSSKRGKRRSTSATPDPTAKTLKMSKSKPSTDIKMEDAEVETNGQQKKEKGTRALKPYHFQPGMKTFKIILPLADTRGSSNSDPTTTPCESDKPIKPIKETKPAKVKLTTTDTTSKKYTVKTETATDMTKLASTTEPPSTVKAEETTITPVKKGRGGRKRTANGQHVYKLDGYGDLTPRGKNKKVKLEESAEIESQLNTEQSSGSMVSRYDSKYQVFNPFNTSPESHPFPQCRNSMKEISMLWKRHLNKRVKSTVLPQQQQQQEKEKQQLHHILPAPSTNSGAPPSNSTAAEPITSGLTFTNISGVGSDICSTAQFNPTSRPCCVCRDSKTDAESLQEMLICNNCGLNVHASCYGIELDKLEQPAYLYKWHCDPCSNDLHPLASTHYSCSLCNARECDHDNALRGEKVAIPDAFKRTVNGKWCHLLCALFNDDCSFGDPKVMQPVYGTQLSLAHHLSNFCRICGVVSLVSLNL